MLEIRWNHEGHEGSEGREGRNLRFGTFVPFVSFVVRAGPGTAGGLRAQQHDQKPIEANRFYKKNRKGHGRAGGGGLAAAAAALTWTVSRVGHSRFVPRTGNS
ncbi:MAG: hypothetical protein AB1716_02895 [Planctomycetota bacterium]